jgi:hypothetical protein
MVQMLSQWMQVMNGIVWGPPMIVLPGLHRIVVRESKDYVGRVIRVEGRGVTPGGPAE